ncbi:MAG: glycosyl transferase, family 39 [Rhodospirillales bacterium]|nr:glycosyl transferase, family 39 [Rhodospirillales bacterium]
MFLARNYGEAAAIDVFRDHLPPAISGPKNYYLWGPAEHNGTVIIATADDTKEADRVCTSVETVGRTGSPDATPDETGLLLIICRGLRFPLIDYWPRFKNDS